MSELKLGIYKHYKGHYYQVIGAAHDANADWRTCVVYMPLELDEAHLGLRMAVRTYEDFMAWVPKLDLRNEAGERVSTPEPRPSEQDKARSEGWIPRFEYHGMELTGDMLVNRE